MARENVTLSHNLMGCRLDNWMKLLRQNPISPKHRHQAELMTAVSILMAPPAALERMLFDEKIRKTRLRKHPLYIVGFWRSGTTFLQNLLSRDPQFAWFDPVNTVTFSNSILMGPALKKVIGRFLEGTRPMDNLEYTTDLPMEEVFAQATISTQAISHMLVFPDGGRGTKYIKTAFVDEQSPRRRKEWRRSYDYILRKVTYLKGGKQLMLKSPENTCRIAELKRMYSGAKFINIYREPYTVVMSAINMFQKEMGLFCLNEPASPQVIENVAINLMAKVYKKAIRELEAIPEQDRINIRYEDFCADPMAGLERIYSQLGLDGFEKARPYFEAYLDSQKGYQKNHFEMDDRLRRKVNRKLKFYFDYYGYEMQTDQAAPPVAAAQAEAAV